MESPKPGSRFAESQGPKDVARRAWENRYGSKKTPENLQGFVNLFGQGTLGLLDF